MNYLSRIVRSIVGLRVSSTETPQRSCTTTLTLANPHVSAEGGSPSLPFSLENYHV